MVDFLKYFLVMGISSVLFFIFIFYNRKEDEVFVKLSIIFIFIFFLIPFYMIIYTNGIHYGIRFIYFDSDGVFRSAIGICVFVVGYFLKDINRLLSGNKKYIHIDNDTSNAGELLEISKGGVFFAFSLGMLCFFLYQIVAPDSKELYDIRRGLAEGNHIVFFLSIISTTLMFSAFFLCIKAKWHLLASLCITLILAGYLVASPGRTTLALALIIFVIFFSGISPRALVNFLPLAIILLFPVIINGKEIIYYIIMEGDFSYILTSYDISLFPKEEIFKNLGHPFVSMVLSDDLVDIVGRRFFYDYVQGFLFYFRVIGLDFGDSLTYYNTEMLLGLNESIIPPGYIAFGYVQATYLGIFISGIFYRMTFKIFSMSSLYKISSGKELIFYASFISANTFYTGDMRQLVVSFFAVVVIMHLVGILAVRKRLPRSGGRHMSNA